VDAPSLSAACTTAFTVVFLLLGFLALVIHLIGLALPVRPPRTDPAVVAAISAAVAARHGGAQVVQVREAP
jgi:hypothetical protein